MPRSRSRSRKSPKARRSRIVRRSRSRSRSLKFSTYAIKKFLTEVFPDEEKMSITSDAVSYLNKIIEKTGSLLIKSTCSKGELSIQNASHAAKQLFTPEIYKYVKFYGDKAIDNPDNSLISFSVRSVHALVKSCSKDKVVTRKVALFITSVLESIVYVIVESAGFQAISKKRKRITVDHVEFGIDEDSELPTTVYRIVI